VSDANDGDTAPDDPGINCKRPESPSQGCNTKQIAKPRGTQDTPTKGRGGSSHGVPATQGIASDGSGGSSGDPYVLPKHGGSDPDLPDHVFSPFSQGTDYSCPGSTWQEGANEQLTEDGKSDKGKPFKSLPRDQDRSSRARTEERDRKMNQMREEIARETRDYMRRREKMEGELAEMEQEIEKDHQIRRTKNRKRSSTVAFMEDMDMRHEIEGYLLGKGKRPSKNEPTNFVLSNEEWVNRLVRHQGAESQITAIRTELMELGQNEEDVREWLLRHHNERWYRGNGEWDDLNYSMQQRLYWIGVEQRDARARIAAIEAQVIAMAVFEDVQKMTDQAKAAAEELSMKFIGPRNGNPGPPPPPFYPPRCRWGGLLDHDGRQVTYEEYLQGYLERKARDLIRRRRQERTRLC